ncbi:MAG: aspartate/glutamate racemase family protein [Candidatus Hermodarchaeota archaeon]
MKIIGLIGGMSWESSLEYYRIINESVKNKLGGLHSGKILMYSVDFQEIEKFQSEGNWDKLTEIMINCAQVLEKAGADMILICTNTMHKMADAVQDSVKIPLIHIADTTGEKIKEINMKRIGLLGTKYTMEQDFYRGRLKKKFDIDVVIPEAEEREIINDIIFKELCVGEIKDGSREKYKKYIEELVQKGAEGIVLGCTEIPLLIKQNDVSVPIFDTMTIHAEYAVNYAINKE